MKQSHVFVLLSILIGILVPVVTLELGFRLLWKEGEVWAPLEPDEILHHRWKANHTAIGRARSIPYTLKTNAQHWVEEYDVEVEKNDKYRIFFLGDSNTEGVVDHDFKWTEVLEKALNKKYIGKNIEGINTGTSSYSILQYYLLSKHFIQKYKPDLVVISVDMNDIPGDYFYRSHLRLDSQGAPDAIASDESNSTWTQLTPFGHRTLNFFEWAFIRLSKQSSFFGWLAQKTAKKTYALVDMGQKSDEPANWLSQKWSEAIEKNVQFSMDILGKTIDLLGAQGIKTIVVGVPYYSQYDGSFSIRPFDELKKTTQEHKALYFDLFDAATRKVGKPGLRGLYWESDTSHFNREGNQVWAESIYDFIVKQNVLEAK